MTSSNVSLGRESPTLNLSDPFNGEAEEYSSFSGGSESVSAKLRHTTLPDGKHMWESDWTPNFSVIVVLPGKTDDCGRLCGHYTLSLDGSGSYKMGEVFAKVTRNKIELTASYYPKTVQWELIKPH